MEQFLAALGTILGIAGMLIIRDIRDGKSVFKKNGNNIHDEIGRVLDSQFKLKEHFNDETTTLLTEIREGIQQINRKHDEWEKYGIPTRECITERKP